MILDKQSLASIILIWIICLSQFSWAQSKETLRYQSEEISFQNGEEHFAGTLTLPRQTQKSPAIILITGSGGQNRDEEILGFKIFAQISDYLSQEGIAVLRYDDRGVGGSKGKSVDESTTADFAQDVLQAVEYLKTRPEIDPEKIGLLGHSEGGVVAPLAYQNNPEIAFVILMAGTGVNGLEVITEQTKAIMKAQNVPESMIQSTTQLNAEIYKIILAEEGADWDMVEKKVEEAILANFELYPESIRAMVKDTTTFIKSQAQQSLQRANTPWFRYFLSLDPEVALQKVKCPILVLFGELDLQVLPAQNEAPILEALKVAGNQDVTVKIFPKANHLFQEAITGSPNEYAKLEKKFVPGFLEYIGNWLKERAF